MARRATIALSIVFSAMVAVPAWWLVGHDPGRWPPTTIGEHGQELHDAQHDDLGVSFAEGSHLPVLVETLVHLSDPAQAQIERIVGLYIHRQPRCDDAQSCVLMVDTRHLTGDVRVTCGVGPSTVALHRLTGSVEAVPYEVLDCKARNGGASFRGGPTSPVLLVHFDDVPSIASIDDASGEFSTVLKIEQRDPGPILESAGPNWSMNLPTASTMTTDGYVEVGNLRFLGVPEALWNTILVKTERSALDVITPDVVAYEQPAQRRASLLGALESTADRVMRYVDTSMARRWHIYDQLSLIATAIGASGLVGLLRIGSKQNCNNPS